MKCAMYGDLFCGRGLVVFLPMYLYRAASSGDQPEAAAVVCITLVAVLWFSNWSFVKSENGCDAVGLSWMAFFATSSHIISSTLCHWPHSKDQRLLLVHFLRQLIVAGANRPLPFYVKMAMGCVAATTTLMLSVASPLYTLHENGPFVAGGLAIFVLFHIAVARFSSTATASGHMITKQQTSTQQSLVCRIAIVLSISILLYFLVSEAIAMAIQPGYSVVIGGYNIIRGMLFALAGLEMADFCERRRDDTTPTTMLHISRAALSVSGVAVVFTNQHKSVVWLNAAFALFMNAATNHSSLLNVSLEDLLRPSSDNAQKLNQCFRTTGTSEADILVRGKIVHVTVMAASTAASEEPSFVVELHDVTEQRSLEWFMQSSQEAMCGEITSGTRTTSRDQR